MRRQLANMAARIGQRIVGSVLARLVSVVAGGVGLVLIAKDIWDLRKGVLPIIAEEMKAKATKDKVQEELAKSLDEQIGEHVKEIGTKAAERVVQIWQEFRRAHAKVLDLAERNPAFRSFLDSVKPEALPRLDEVTSLVLQSEGEPGLLRRLDDGSLDEAVKVVPAAAIDIARETRSIDLALKWSSLAGEHLQDVAGYELHRRANPDQFTKASLQRLFAIGDRLAIMRLGSIDREARDILFERQPDELKTSGPRPHRKRTDRPGALSHRPAQGAARACARRRHRRCERDASAGLGPRARRHPVEQRSLGRGRHDAAAGRSGHRCDGRRLPHRLGGQGEPHAALGEASAGDSRPRRALLVLLAPAAPPRDAAPARRQRPRRKRRAATSTIRSADSEVAHTVAATPTVHGRSSLL